MALIVGLLANQNISLGSNIKCESNLIDQLASTCRVWGFLKYHHPYVSSGRYNWDYGLYKFTQNYLGGEMERSLSEATITAIYSLGFSGSNCRGSKSQINRTSFDSIYQISAENWTIPKSILRLLQHIKTQRKISTFNYYAQYGANYEYSNFHEREYKFTQWNRFTMLFDYFRFWNVIEYFYPLKHQLEKDWGDELKYRIKRILAIKKPIEFELEWLRILSVLNDSHIEYTNNRIDSLIGICILPIKSEYIDNKVIVTGFYCPGSTDISGLRIGDQIIEINGISVDTLLSTRFVYISGSNQAVRFQRLQRHIRRTDSEICVLKIERNEKTFELKQRTYDRDFLMKPNCTDSTSKSWFEITDGIGYIDMSKLTINEVDAVFESFLSTRGIIFDLRGYTNRTCNYILPFLIDSSKYPIKLYHPDFQNPGSFHCTYYSWKNSSQKKNKKYSGKIVLLVDENTQSEAEWTAIMFQQFDKCVVLGTPTAEVPGNASKWTRMDGTEIWFTGLGVNYPKDSLDSEYLGVKIDSVIHQTIDGIIKGRDDILTAAINLLDV